ncbi:MAG: phenylpyruvate tautomerase MIF-related protein [Lachnospiraceae bacterium]|nr:phenylpyruvate tautomerase MIF-related protein [Lachnospiraceae bacterium]
MPFINTKTNVTISKEQEEAIKSRFGEVISDIGKTESWLMVGFEEKASLYFKGQDSPCAILDISLYGKAAPAAYESLTKDVTQIVSEELQLPSDRIYVKYQEVDYWGWNGGNF